MPSLDLTPVDTYSPLWPYHYEFDNIPILQLVNQNLLINNAVENTEEILRSATGTQGTLSNRLNQSINDDGTLRVDAVDATLHNIGAHEDGVYGGISYIRMQQDERDKLSLISDEATSLSISFPDISTTPTFDDDEVQVSNSDSVTWRVEGNKIYADLAFPASAAHQHFYDKTPPHSNPSSPDYKNYKTTSVSTVFIEDSLRVYVNGTRLSSSASVYVPGPTPSSSWTLLSYTPSYSTGTFVLSTAITSSDVIRIDFDTSY